MTLIIRLVTAAALLSAFVDALSVSPPDVLARHHRIARDAADLVEKSAILEERSSHKVGLGWTGNDESNIPSFVSSQTKYIYTWSPYCPQNAPEHGLECCPMLWGTKQIAEFEANKHKGGKCILGMNEVNVPSQGYISVGEGIQIWNEHIRPMHKDGYYLLTPSVTSGEDGLVWLKEFFQRCGGPGSYCDASGLPFHYYGIEVNDFIFWAEKFHGIFPGDIWVTEIACQNFGNPRLGQCNKDRVWSFMDGTTRWMSETHWIKAYFFFGMFWDMYNVNPENRMVDADGKPNNLGHHYVGHA